MITILQEILILIRSVKILSDRHWSELHLLSVLLKQEKSWAQTLSSLMRALHRRKYQYGVFLGPRRGFLSGSSSPSS